MELELPEDPEFWEAVAYLAHRQNVSPDEAIRRAVLWRREQLAGDAGSLAAYQRVSTKYRDALDRLGNA